MKTGVIIMIGCFGSHPFDRMRERELDRYLDSLEEDENTDEEFCPICGEPLNEEGECLDIECDNYKKKD